MDILDISFLGFRFKLDIKILILIAILYVILVGHTVGGCCNYDLIQEAFTNSSPAPGFFKGVGATALHKDHIQSLSHSDPSNNLLTQQSNSHLAAAGATIHQKTKKEGFVGASTNAGQSSPFDLNSSASVDTASWNPPNMTVVAGQPLSKGVQDFLAREPQPVPLPEGEILLFANTPFKPECCPNTYSNSSGCACMTGGQYNYLTQRGGNNVPYSEY